MQQNNTGTTELPDRDNSAVSQDKSLSLHSTQLMFDSTHETNSPLDFNNVASKMFCVKKGVLWQQQDYGKFHQRLFSRWKKRFFILTTDHLVCFKRSTSKIGASKMGPFLHQTSLGDILKIDWLRPKKSDKGAIILRMKDQFNIFLWSKENLDEWMTLIEAMRLKRLVRGGPAEDNNQEIGALSNQNGIYENATLPTVCDDQLIREQTAPSDTKAAMKKMDETALNRPVRNSSSEQKSGRVTASSVASSSEHFNHGVMERESLENGDQQQMDDGSCANNVAHSHDGNDARPHASMINDDDDADGGAPAKGGPSDGEQQQNLSSDDRSNSDRRARKSKHSRDPSSHNGIPSSASSTSRSSSVRRKNLSEARRGDSTESTSTKHTVRRDSNDNLVLVDAKSKREMSECVPERTSSGQQQETGLDEGPMELELDDRVQNKQSSKLQKSDNDAVERNHPHSQQQPEERAPSQRIEGRRSIKQERPVSNLIRRDDSWHSSLSLNQVGNNHMQAKRSLYTQNITPANSPGQQANNFGPGHLQMHSNINSIEANATPLRGRPPIRQQSMQLQHNTRRLPPIGQHQANSFDVGQIPNSPSQLHNNQAHAPPTSYHQKLLQLQLLHNSNNIDYVRNNIDPNGANNDYQIYGPGSIATTNHYGYYSMRSNLKSAASEFSFIRPNSSDFHAPNSALQPPLPLPPQQGLHIADQRVDVSQQQHSNNRASLVLANNQSLDYENSINGSSRGQYLVQNGSKLIRTSAGEVANNHQALNHGLCDLTSVAAAAPNRDLPLKPNKKRQQLAGNGPHSQKNSSNTLGSSIVHFFRRAFSKRSKRRPKMAESCSSSLGGALDDKFESIQRTRSAFSTSEGTRLDRNEINDQQQSLIKQRHRMIDLIEAFGNKTALDQETYNKLSQQNRVDSAQHLSAMLQQRASIQNELSTSTKLAQYHPQQLVGSPLHKSNSISTSTGLSGLNEMMRLNERQMLMNSQHSPAIGPRNVGPMSSPMVTRSTKVMSANLTPLFNRKEAQEHESGGYFASPRCSANVEHLPRPSSIYGQPSMISSPVSSNARDQRSTDFGSHRSSIHSYHQRSDRGPLNTNIDLRRGHHHQATIKAPFLDTTREVAEEVSSPTTESKAFIDYEPHTRDCNNSDTINEPIPNSYSIRQHHHQRRAIVNPILQSPTMSLIYDNHPMPMGGNTAAYSHYDNHRPIEYQQSMSSMDLSAHSYSHQAKPINLHLEDLQHGGNQNRGDAILSPVAANRGSKVRQSFNISNHTSAFATPSHRNMRFSQQQSNNLPDGPYLLEMDKNHLDHVKPAAIVAPSTPPSHLRNQESNYASRVAVESTNQFNPYSQSGSRPNSMMKPSPIKTSHQPNTHYQQSPLVNRQTRVLKRGDGVQTTVIHPEQFARNGTQPEAVVNIVGAPGVNLEPSLAHSLLRGTNINAFESSASGLHMDSSRANSNTKTFLVSSRLSKTISESPTDVGMSNIKQNGVMPDAGKTECQQLKQEDESSSRSTSSGTEPSTSTSSSAQSNPSTKRRGTKDSGARSFRLDKGDCDGRGVKADRKESSSRSSNDSRRRGSSTDHSDEHSSQAESFDEPPPGGRKWVTSKLVQ